MWGSMIELSISARNTAPPPLATPASGAGADGFARAMDAVSDTSPSAPTPAEPRQGDADGGKKLPLDATDRAGEPARPATARRPARPAVDPAAPTVVPAIVVTATTASPIAAKSSDDADDAPADGDDATDDAGTATPIIAFFAAPAAPIMIDPARLPATAPRATNPAIAAATAQAAPAPLDPNLTAAPTAATPAITSAPASAGALPAAFELLDAGSPARAATAPAEPTAATAPRIAAHSDTPRFAIAAAALVSDPATITAQPARQAFATALAALSVRAALRDDDRGEPPQPIAGLAAPTADTLLRSAVQQAAASDQAALDPRHDRGLHGMIDHIEMLRDDANARDTRIRLTPDALGTVDVALRRDGDALHVRFSSANEATRLVLGDAQPRLAALAEARGVRLAGSSIDAGTPGDAGNGGQPQPQPRTESFRPARARRAVAAETDIPSDQRLA